MTNSTTRRFTRITGLVAAAAISVSTLAACSHDDQNLKLRVGTTEASSKAWEVIEQQADAAGLDLEVVDFSDYSTPNKALSEGTIDANAFQHLKFLAQYNKGENDNLVPVASTYIVPLSVFWKGHDSIDGIEGETIAIPSDPTNQARAINVLATAGLLKLKEEALITPNPSDIDEAASKVKVNPIAPEQTTVAYGEGKPAVINNNFLGRAGIDPESAAYKDNPTGETSDPYINVIATREENQDDPAIQKFIEIYHTPEVAEAQAEDTNGTSIRVNRPKAELIEILKKLS